MHYTKEQIEAFISAIDASIAYVQTKMDAINDSGALPYRADNEEADPAKMMNSLQRMYDALGRRREFWLQMLADVSYTELIKTHAIGVIN